MNILKKNRLSVHSSIDGITRILKEKKISYSISLSDRVVYSSDINGLPYYHYQWKSRPLADLVVWPKNQKELQVILPILKKTDLPIIPRGGATSYTSACLPKDGGIILDMKHLNRISIDRDKNVVQCDAGVNISRLMDELTLEDLTLPIMPSSSLSATLGGWLANGGKVGIGSFGAGKISQYLKKLEILTPMGEIKQVKEHKLIKKCLGNNGQNLLILSAEIQTIEVFEKVPLLIKIPGIERTGRSKISKIQKILNKVHDSVVPDSIWHVRVSNFLRDEVGNKFPRAHNIGKNSKGSILEKDKMGLIFENTYLFFILKDRATKQKVENVVSSRFPSYTKASLYTEKMELKEQYKSELLLRMNQRVIMAQTFFCEVKTALCSLDFLESLSESYNLSVFYHTYLRGDGMCRFVVLIPTTDLVWEHLMSSKALVHEYSKYLFEKGAVLYSNGLQNQTYMEKFPDMRKKHDINPLKHLQGHSDFINVSLTDTGRYDAVHITADLPNTDCSDPDLVNRHFYRVKSKMKYITLDIMMKLNSWWRKLAGKLGIHKTLQTDRKDKDMKILKSISCTNCGFCRKRCPAYIGTKNELYTPSGRYNALHFFLKYKIPIPEKFIQSLYYCSTCAQCEVNCPIGFQQTKILEIIRSKFV